MKYLFLLLLLAGCTVSSSKETEPAPKEPKLSKEDSCHKQSVLQCLDIGDEDEYEREFCQKSVYEECMKK